MPTLSLTVSPNKHVDNPTINRLSLSLTNSTRCDFFCCQHVPITTRNVDVFTGCHTARAVFRRACRIQQHTGYGWTRDSCITNVTDVLIN
jgi:hypothetical protein